MLWTMISFIGFTVLVAVISGIATKDDKQDSTDGYFLAGRGLPGFVIAGSLLLAPHYPGTDLQIHYLYAVLVLLPLELLILFALNANNKKKHPELQAWSQEDVGAVDLTPWKYRKICAVLIIICCIVVYAAFSPLGFGTWAYAQPF